MGLADKIDLEAKRIKQEAEKRGIRIVDATLSKTETDTSGWPKCQKPKLETVAPLNSVPINPNKFKSFYNYIMDSGLLIAPTRELSFGKAKESSLDEAGINKLTLSENSYNANLTFTMLTALLQNTSMIYFGPPGSGKTTTAEIVVSGMYNIPLSAVHEATIYGNPEVTQETMLAFIELSSFFERKEIIGIREFMKAPARIIDEVNRLPPSKLSLLLNVLDRGWTVYNNKKIIAKPGPLFATANSADAGNYEMTPAFIDRFDIASIVGEINPAHISHFAEVKDKKIRYIEDKIIEPPEKISIDDIINARKQIYFGISVPDVLLNKMAHFLAELGSCDKAGMSIESKTKGHALYKLPGPLCKDCKYHTNDKTICYATENSLSARTISTVYAYTKALSWWRGDQKAIDEDLRYVLAFSSWFKLRPTRTILEKEEGFINDRIAMVYHLWDTASKSYEEIVNFFPDYKTITRTVADYYIKKIKPDKKVIEDMINLLHKIDSPSKFFLAVSLKEMYQDYDRIK